MSTFLDLTNRVLRRLNEVELTSGDFTSARGIQAAAKDGINSAVFDLNRQQFTWPFNAAEELTTLVIGQTEYSNPNNLKTMEWDSFRIVKDDTTATESTCLDFIDRDVWYKRLRNEDVDNAATGLEKPRFVFPSHGTGFGVTPAPDKTYRLSFRYFLHPVELVAATDQITGNTTYPTALIPTIIEGAMYHLYMFKDNPESAQFASRNFEMGVADLKSQYINQYHSIRDTRVQFGGGNSRSMYQRVSNL